MVNAIFEYLDYRAYLRDRYEQEKKEKPYFSYRYMSGKVGINPGYVVKVLQGTVHLGVKNISAFADLLKLEGKEREYFAELVHFGRATSETEMGQRFERLQAIKGLRFRTVADGSVAFWQRWYHMAMRSLLSIHSFDGGNYRRLGALLSPPITAGEARESVQLLERLGLVTRDAAGIFRVTEQFISTGEKWAAPAIREYQKKTMELAAEALERHDKESRDISTVTMTFSSRDLPALRERIKLFRQELLRMSQECSDEDMVMQFNVQVFPVALVGRETRGPGDAGARG